MWKVVPLCERQLLDVNPKDILNSGHFRKCDTYKGGGGYDQFPHIAEKRLGRKFNHQFVVQLQGCPLRCPYCYVTQEGIWGNSIPYSSEDLVVAFKESDQQVFHLMGGAPASYLENWHTILDLLPKDKIFHSDLMLVEKKYDLQVLKNLNRSNALYAVNIKGVTPDDFYNNTQVRLVNYFWDNLDIVVNSGINFYLTFTNPDKSELDNFKTMVAERYGVKSLEDSFTIDLIVYNAVK